MIRISFTHGRNTKISVDGDDLSAFTNSVEIKLSADSHDVTTFGKTAHIYASGLTDGTVTLKGIYEDGAASPQLTLQPLLGGALAEVVYQPEGTGSGKPTWTFDAQVTAYEESAPVAEMISWSAELQVSEAIAATTQGP